MSIKKYKIVPGLCENVLAIRLVMNKIGTALDEDQSDYSRALANSIITWRAHGFTEHEVIRRARAAVDSGTHPGNPEFNHDINTVVDYMAHAEELYPFRSIDSLAEQIAINRAPSIAAARRLIRATIDDGLIVRHELPNRGCLYLLAHEPITQRVLSVVNAFKNSKRHAKFPDGIPMSEFRHDVSRAICGGIFRATEATHRAINAGMLNARYERRTYHFHRYEWFIISANETKETNK